MACAIGAVPARAGTVNDEQFWSSIIVGTSIAGRLGGTVQLQNRMTNHARTRSALLVRPVISYALDRRWSLAMSYAHVDMPLEPNAVRSEEQLYQQVGYAIGPVGGGALSTRLRVEQRWREGRAKTGWRLRGELRWLKPFARRPTAPSLLLWEEPVVELKRTDFGSTAGDLQFRSFAGVSVPLSRSIRLEPGYLNIYGHRQRRDDLFYHVAQVTLNVRL